MSKLLVKWASFGYQKSDIRTSVVFGTNADNVIFVLKNDEVLAFGKNPDGCLGAGVRGEVKELKRIENLCGQGIEGFECAGYEDKFCIFAISRSGSVFSWGENGFGQLGLGTTKETKVPTKISGLLEHKKIVQVASGGGHTLALTSEGEVYAFGRNYSGQLGLGTTVDQSFPRKVGGLLDGKIVTSVACQKFSSFALQNSGEICCWGDNRNDRLGLSSSSRQECNPCLVIGLEGVVISQIVCGDHFTLALSDAGKIYSWGENGDGQLGNGTTEFVKRPTILSTEMGRVREIATTLCRSHPCAAITENNQVYIWGRVNGQIIATPMLTSHSSLEEVFAVFYPPVNHKRFRLKEESKIVKHENKQNNGPSIFERFRKEFDNPETADVVFIVEGKKIHVHRNLLTVGSDVFKNKFLSEWEDSRKKEQTIEAHSYDAFYAFLKYFYTDEVGFSPELAIEVYALAHFYLVTDLMDECEKILKSGLTVQNVAAIFEKAILLEAQNLRELCFKFCSDNLVDVVENLESEDIKSEIYLEVFHRVACLL
ncbi:Hypothetical predicted protein [Cloeon dipterum]|uniref:BTB domain-containing protein n=1 Tax=Cloeon dipterum TaxID=197152 RepID=A0A8S1DAC9_9INSE|nr:Hypothetical predicted protein [Cloeon dipterum]